MWQLDKMCTIKVQKCVHLEFGQPKQVFPQGVYSGLLTWFYAQVRTHKNIDVGAHYALLGNSNPIFFVMLFVYFWICMKKKILWMRKQKQISTECHEHSGHSKKRGLPLPPDTLPAIAQRSASSDIWTLAHSRKPLNKLPELNNKKIISNISPS